MAGFGLIRPCEGPFTRASCRGRRSRPNRPLADIAKVRDGDPAAAVAPSTAFRQADVARGSYEPLAAVGLMGGSLSVVVVSEAVPLGRRVRRRRRRRCRLLREPAEHAQGSGSACRHARTRIVGPSKGQPQQQSLILERLSRGLCARASSGAALLSALCTRICAQCIDIVDPVWAFSRTTTSNSTDQRCWRPECLRGEGFSCLHPKFGQLPNYPQTALPKALSSGRLAGAC